MKNKKYSKKKFYIPFDFTEKELDILLDKLIAHYEEREKGGDSKTDKKKIKRIVAKDGKR